MKKLSLLSLATAMLLSLTVGCRNTGPRTSPLPGVAGTTEGGTTGGDRRPKLPDISTAPVPGGDKAIAGTAGSAVSGDLPDNDKLAGRDEDRTKFAAQTVYFEFDRANVKSSEGAKIDDVAHQFKAMSAGHDLLIEGHCDERGTEEYNRALGERRALAVRELLVKAGVDAGRVYTKSFGKDQPAIVGHDEVAWSKNRRGEFILVLPRKISTTQNTQ